MTSTITIGIDPFIELGPVTLAWHGLTIAIGIVIGGIAAARAARERGLPVDPLYTIGILLALGGVVGGRIFYLLETDPGALLRPDDLLGARGFTFGGGLILAAIAIAGYLRLRRLSPRYLDAVAAALPLGVAIGRIGDVINGEHYGPASSFFLAVRNAHPDADVPSHEVAFHSGGLYEVILSAAIFALAWPLRHRFRSPTSLVWLVVGLFALGRFVMFFYRLDSQPLAAGLDSAQWTSVALGAVAVAGGLAVWRCAATGTLRPRPPLGGRRSSPHGWGGCYWMTRSQPFTATSSVGPACRQRPRATRRMLAGRWWRRRTALRGSRCVAFGAPTPPGARRP